MAESKYCVARLHSWSNKRVEKYSYKDTFSDKCVPPSYVRLDSIGEELQNSGGSKMWGDEIKEFCEICEHNPAFLEYSQHQHGAAICEDFRKLVSNACDPFDSVYDSAYSSLLDTSIAAEAVDTLVVIQPAGLSTEVIDLNQKSSSNEMATFLQEVVASFEPGLNKENNIRLCKPVDTLLEKGTIVESPEIFQELSNYNPAPLSDPVITCVGNDTCISLSKQLIGTSASLDSQHKLKDSLKDSAETIEDIGIVSKPMHSTFFRKKSSSNEDSDDNDEDSDEEDEESDEEDEESDEEDEESENKDEEEDEEENNEEEDDSDGWDEDDGRYVDAANLSACQSYSAVVAICVSESEWSDGIAEEINKVPKEKINKLPRQNENISINIVSVVKDIFGMDCSSIGDAETENDKKIEEINKNWFHLYSSDDLHTPTSRSQKSVRHFFGHFLI